MKTLTIILFLALSFYAQCQPNKGNFLISGSLSYSTTKSKYVSTFSGLETTFKSRGLSLEPLVGYFPVNRFCVGVSLPTRFSRTRVNDSEPSNSQSLHIGPFARYYVPINEKLFGLIEAGYEWGFSKTKSLFYNPTTGNLETTTFDFRNNQYHLAIGCSYFLNSNMAVELLGNYSSSSNDSGQEASGFNTSLGLQIYISK